MKILTKSEYIDKEKMEKIKIEEYPNNMTIKMLRLIHRKLGINKMKKKKKRKKKKKKRKKRKERKRRKKKKRKKEKKKKKKIKKKKKKK